jgi:hypothetical protein
MFPVWLVLFIFGGVAIGVATASEDQIKEACEKANE